MGFALGKGRGGEEAKAKRECFLPPTVEVAVLVTRYVVEVKVVVATVVTVAVVPVAPTQEQADEYRTAPLHDDA